MALLNPYMEKLSLSSDTLELEAGSNESLLIKEVQVDNLANVEFAELSIDRTTIGYFDCYDMYSNGIWMAKDKVLFPNLFGFLREKGLFEGYPVASGQKFKIDITGATNNNCRVIYERHDAGDILATAPNGVASDEYIFINYGQNKSTITDATYGDIDESLNPVEFPNFPFGDVVPANMEIDLLGMWVAWRRNGTYVGNRYTYLRMLKERTVMFDDDKNGVYVAHGMGNFPIPSEGYDRHPELFPTPYTFTPGEELSVELKANYGAGISTDTIYVAFLERVRKV